MLHDPSHKSVTPESREIGLSAKEKDVLRKLASELAVISSDKVHDEKAGLWRDLNDLKMKRPMVWINEIPWHEMNVDDELTLECEDKWARYIEDCWRKTIYQWKHMPADMVVDNFLTCEKAIHGTDFGIIEDVDIASTDESSDVVSRHFKIQIKEPADIEKIKMPVITHNVDATRSYFEAMSGAVGDIMPIKVLGQSHIWFTPWDYLIRWWGVQEAMMDFVLRPEMVHDAVERMVDAWMVELDQFVEQDLLELDNRNIRVGSGGYGYVSDLPGENFEACHVRPVDMWGCSNAQVFSEVSPEMHWEFAVRHDMRWLERWGLVYYGCCEPLDKKMDVMRRIRNLRKVSVTPWADFENAIRQIGGDYVISYKPNPAILAETKWDPATAERDLREVLEKSEGCNIELIMKDISTVRYEPERVWEWSQIAMRLVEEYSG